MRKIAAKVCIAIGAVLIFSALLLVCFNAYISYKAGQEAELLMGEIHQAIEALPQTELPQLSPEMPVVEIEGYGYIGYLSIPELGLELPVMDQWDYNRLTKAPCRHFGSARTDDLVIAAHNYETHFKHLGELTLGSEVTLTDMEGYSYRYTLQLMQTLQPDAVDAVQHSGYDLVLYTCTPGGAARVVAFFNRTA